MKAEMAFFRRWIAFLGLITCAVIVMTVANTISAQPDDEMSGGGERRALVADRGAP
jgi:uncharacterized membrane protein YdfJ with MMPL/SSD domain